MAIIKRPMQHRQITGAMFGEPAVLIRRSQTRNRFGEDDFSETRTNITVAANPISSRDPRLASLREGGTRVEGLFEFFTVQEISVDPPDYIEYESTRYIAHSTANFGSHNESIFVRAEVQP